MILRLFSHPYALLFCIPFLNTLYSQTKEAALFDLKAITNPATLEEEVIEDWHLVPGSIPTRQKFSTIHVGELWPGQDLRIPVRYTVPSTQKATGFHLTGGNQLKRLQNDTRPNGVDIELLKGGIGLVQTIVQEPRSYGQAELGEAMKERFLQTLDPHYSIQYWGWPAILMRSITAAHAETNHFAPGKIAVSGGSKNGASPSVALIADKRITAQHATVSPLWESPLRLCDENAWKALKDFEKRQGNLKPHFFLGGTFGPIYNQDALKAGHSWADIKALAHQLSDSIFVSKNLDQLAKRKVDLLYHPGTHDFVAFDLPSGGTRYPGIPIFYEVNTGHGKKPTSPSLQGRNQNKAAFLLQHFFPEKKGDLLHPPKSSYLLSDDTIKVSISATHQDTFENGRIWWMFDRPLEGSHAYLSKAFPEDSWANMDYDAKSNSWTVEIPRLSGAKSVDFFSSHRKTIKRKSGNYDTYISSPYTRVEFN